MRNHRRHLMSRIPNPASRIPMLAGVAIALGACATLGLVFDVDNPNDYRIRSTRIEVGVDLESTHFGDAYLERPLDLSPTNHNRVVVPTRFEWSGVGAGARALFTRQAINYALTGRVVLETPLGDKRVGMTGRGQV